MNHFLTLIFDITGKLSSKLMNYSNSCKKLRYKTALVWGVTNRQVSLLRNQLRNRVVRESLLHEIHNQINTIISGYLKSSDEYNFDKAWIVFNGSDKIKDLTKEFKKELFNKYVIK